MIKTLFDLEIFKHYSEKPKSLTQDVVEALASNVKKLLPIQGKQAFSDWLQNTAFAGSGDAIFDTAPSNAPVSYTALSTMGVPEGCCPTTLHSPAEHAERLYAYYSRTDPAKFLLDACRGGYLEQDDVGEWSTYPIPRKEFERMWRSAGAVIGEKHTEDFLAHIKPFTRSGYFPNYSTALVTIHGIPTLNLYRPPELMPIDGDWSDYDKLTFHLVKHDKAAQQHLLDWIAVPLQSIHQKGKPLKMGTMMTLHGVQGTGKQLLCDAISHMYGEWNTARLDQDRLDSKFNGQLKNKLYVVLNETQSDTNRSQATANKLKMLTTDTRISEERKGADAGTLVNTFNLINCTNKDRPLILEQSDRRNIIHHQDIKINESLGTKIHDDERGPRILVSAFYAHLLQRKTNIRIGEIYQTEARKHQILECESSDLKFWREVVTDGIDGVAAPWISAAPPNQVRALGFQLSDQTWWYASSVMREVYQDWCRRHGLRATGGNKIFESLKVIIPGAVAGHHFVSPVYIRAWTNIPATNPNLKLIYGEGQTALPALQNTPQPNLSIVPREIT